jgi:hypothetical protein
MIAPNENMPVFMPMDASGKIRTQDMLKLTPMKLDARRAFITSKGKLGGIVINTPAENLLPGNISEKAQSDTRGMQCGCRKVWKWKDIERIQKYTCRK